jgi:hypothetical protein
VYIKYFLHPRTRVTCGPFFSLIAALLGEAGGGGGTATKEMNLMVAGGEEEGVEAGVGWSIDFD